MAVALAELKGAMETGFATVNGSLALLAQRGDQTDQQIAALGGRLDDHDARLDTIERGETDRQKALAARVDRVEQEAAVRRWPLQSVTAVAAVGALALSVWSTLGR
ncbi:hypothetical protein ACWGRF_02140 [Streptomyces zhihengii]